LVANVLGWRGFVARRQSALRSASAWPLTVLADFRFARARSRLSAEVRQERAIASSSSNENVDFRRDDKRIATSTLHVWSERLYYARRGNTRTSSRRRARRKVTFNPGGRICPGGMGPHPGGGHGGRRG